MGGGGFTSQGQRQYFGSSNKKSSFSNGFNNLNLMSTSIPENEENKIE